MLGAEEQSEFEGHVEPGHLGGYIDFGSREVVNTPTTLLNHPQDLSEARVARVVFFRRAANIKPTPQYREDERTKKRHVFVIHGIVDEDAFAVTTVCQSVSDQSTDLVS